MRVRSTRGGSLPVEGPLEEELACRFSKVWTCFVVTEGLVDDILEPGRPLLQGRLVLEGLLEILFQLMNRVIVTLAHP